MNSKNRSASQQAPGRWRQADSGPEQAKHDSGRLPINRRARGKKQEWSRNGRKSAEGTHACASKPCMQKDEKADRRPGGQAPVGTGHRFPLGATGHATAQMAADKRLLPRPRDRRSPMAFRLKRLFRRRILQKRSSLRRPSSTMARRPYTRPPAAFPRTRPGSRRV